MTSCRAAWTRKSEGRGCGPNGDYIALDLTHLGGDTIMKRLPSVHEIGKNFANVDVIKEPIPVVPTIHYQMGASDQHPRSGRGAKERQPEHGGQRPLRHR